MLDANDQIKELKQEKLLADDLFTKHQTKIQDYEAENYNLRTKIQHHQSLVDVAATDTTLARNAYFF